MQKDFLARGFTLIELMITLVIGMVVLAGLVSIFISNTRLSSTLADRTERLGDLYTASHIMQTELRGAQGNLTTIALGLPLRVTYTPGDPYTLAGVACTGYFEYKAATAPATGYRIMWKRPKTTNGTACIVAAGELIRDMAPTIGMQVTALGTNPYANSFLGIDLYSTYLNPDRVVKNISLSFKVWSRN